MTLSDATINSKPPLRLPRYTFLVGGTPIERRNLSEAIAQRDAGMLVESLRSPLVPATQMLFFENLSPGLRIETNALPFRYTAGSIEDWYDQLADALCNFAGPNALAELLLLRMQEADAFAARFLILDTKDDSPLQFLFEKLDPAPCLSIGFSRIDEASVRLLIPDSHYVTVNGSVEAQITQLESALKCLPF